MAEQTALKTSPSIRSQSAVERHATWICAGLLVIHAALALIAVHGKSATADEPLHAVAGWTWLHLGDYRLAPRDPPLFGYVANLASSRSELTIDLDDIDFKHVPERSYLDWIFAVRTLYQTPGNDADAFIGRGRAMMLIFDLLLGILLARWAYQLAGPFAAIVATTLFAFDPNFLAHAALIKNDVAVSCGLFATAWATYRVGRRATWSNVAGLAVIIAITCNIKFSGLLAGPVVAALLGWRAIDGVPWSAFGFSLRSRLMRVVFVLALLLGFAATAIASTWSLYRFRYAPTPDPQISLNFDSLVRQTAKREIQLADSSHEPTTRELKAHPQNSFVRSVSFLNQHHLMPQAWLVGLLYTYQSTLQYRAFLLGQISDHGWWYYFPLAMLFKSPLATIAGFGIACGVITRRLFRREIDWTSHGWAIACIGLPAVAYAVEAIRTNTNLGIRHVLPLGPFIFLFIACVIANHWPKLRHVGRGFFATLGVALAVESCAAFPNYIPFFNIFAGGSRGGLRLLADSNLDWGQDLPELAKWRDTHRGCRLYLSYFGMADPHYYHIDYTPLPLNASNGGDGAIELEEDSHGLECYVAISATNLQGVFLNDDQRRQLHQYVDRLLFEGTINGSIYIFHQPPLLPTDD